MMKKFKSCNVVTENCYRFAIKAERVSGVNDGKAQRCKEDCL